MSGSRTPPAVTPVEADDNALEVWWHGGSRALGPAPKTRLAGQLLDLLPTIDGARKPA